MSDFKAALEALGLFVYPKSIDKAEGTVCAIVRDGKEKLLAVSGAKENDFTGTKKDIQP